MVRAKGGGQASRCINPQAGLERERVLRGNVGGEGGTVVGPRRDGLPRGLSRPARPRTAVGLVITSGCDEIHHRELFTSARLTRRRGHGNTMLRRIIPKAP